MHVPAVILACLLPVMPAATLPSAFMILGPVPRCTPQSRATWFGTVLRGGCEVPAPEIDTDVPNATYFDLLHGIRRFSPAENQRSTMAILLRDAIAVRRPNSAPLDPIHFT